MGAFGRDQPALSRGEALGDLRPFCSGAAGRVVLGMGKGGDTRSCHALNGKTFKPGQSLPFALVSSLLNNDEILHSASQDPGAVEQGGEHALEDRHEHSSHRKGVL